MVRCKRKSLILSNKKGLALTSPVKSLVAGAGRGEAEEPERSDGNRLYGSRADKKAVGSKSITAFYDNKKSRNLLRPRLLFLFGSGGWNRTNGLQVMSLTSYHCSTPHYVLFY